MLSSSMVALLGRTSNQASRAPACSSGSCSSRIWQVWISPVRILPRRPVRVGDVLCVYTEIVSVGRASMKIHIEAWARRFRAEHREKVTDATFTFVAIDDDGRPRPVPA
jgi:acyl-CoA hydrolase